jgi:hypothetical protein
MNRPSLTDFDPSHQRRVFDLGCLRSKLCLTPSEALRSRLPSPAVYRAQCRHEVCLSGPTTLRTLTTDPATPLFACRRALAPPNFRGKIR